MAGAIFRDAAGKELFRVDAPQGTPMEAIQAEADRAFARLQQSVPEAAAAIREQANPLAQAGPEGLQTVGQTALDIGKQEIIPTGLGLAAGAALGPAAGFAARAGAQAGAGVVGQAITRRLRGQPPMTMGETALEAGIAGAGPLGEPALSLFTPSTGAKVVRRFAENAGMRGLRPVVRAEEIAATVQETQRVADELGRRIRSDVPRMRGRLAATRDAKYDAVRALADKHKLTVVPSTASSDAVETVLELASEELDNVTRKVPTGMIDPMTGKEIVREEVQRSKAELQELVGLLNVAAAGGSLPYSDLSRVRLLVHDRVPQFSRMLSPQSIQGRNPYIELRNRLSEDLTNAAAGTPVEGPARLADDFLQNEFKPTLAALNRVNKSPSPESAVAVLVRSDPGQFRRVFRSLDEGAQNEVRQTFMAQLYTEARDEAGIVNLDDVLGKFRALPKASQRELAAGREREFARTLEAMQAESQRMKLAGQFRLPQAITLSVGAGSVGSALATGGMGAALPWLAGTAGGIAVMTKIMSSPKTRRLMAQGLERRGQAGARLIGQAIDRTIADLALPEERRPTVQPGS